MILTSSEGWNLVTLIIWMINAGDSTVVNSIITMFSDLHPSLLLFLHWLECIKFRNLLNDSLIVMRKEIVGNGIIRVSHGKEKITLVCSVEEVVDTGHSS